ncbi:MAG: alpha/beta hydrolase [Pseudomonadota bacterium]
MHIDDGKTRFIEAGGLSFAWQRYGTTTAPALVLVRGLGTQLIEWSPALLDGLVAGGLQVIIFDNRDVGRSSRLKEDYPLSAMAADVANLTDALGIDRFHLLGISLGGMIAQLTAVEYPDRVRSLISIMSSSGDPSLPRPPRESAQRLRVSADTRAEAIDLDVENRAYWGSPAYPETVAVRRAMAEAVYNRAHDPEGVARQMRAAIADGDRTERLNNLTLPALVIHGAEDVLVMPAAGEATARAIPGAAFELVPGMGHNIPAGLAPVIAGHVLKFLRSHNFC